MKVTLREISAFANVMQSRGELKMAESLRNDVLRMIKQNITEIDLDVTDPDQKKTYDLIKMAEDYIAFANNPKSKGFFQNQKHRHTKNKC